MSVVRRWGWWIGIAALIGWGCSENPLDPDSIPNNNSINNQVTGGGDDGQADCDQVCEVLVTCGADEAECYAFCLGQQSQTSKNCVVQAETCEEVVACPQ